MILAVNFKANHTRESTEIYVRLLNFFLNTYPTRHHIKIYPNTSSLLKAEFPVKVHIGAQNFYPIKNGAYTGEIGSEQLDEFEIKDVLIGHSERRIILNETQEIIAKKFDFAKERGWNITYCVGEPMIIRKKGPEAVIEYIKNQLNKIDTSYQKFSIAYEPIWAIGSSISASVEDITKILDSLKEAFGNIPLLYGGGVSLDSIVSIAKIRSCSGVLIGGAAMDVDDFCKLIQAVKYI